MNQITGRFAPTPSGRMHLGNLFCALTSWLSARSQNGRYILRIEDLDPLRCYREYSELIEEDMLWLGLDWDEGGLADKGPHSPYSQSVRTEIYEDALKKLEQKLKIYPCFCSRAELHAANAPHLSDGRVVYSGRCRDLTSEQQAEKLKKRGGALRVTVPDETITFTDLCQGEYSEHLPTECGDFIIRRSDGVFAYQLAVVVDDALMGVTEVVRGRDLLDSAPRQILLHRELGYQPPAFGHHPLILADDGRRLSKRDMDTDMGFLRQRFTAAELLGQLGFAAGLIDRPEPLSSKELLSHFSWEKMKKDDIKINAALFFGEQPRGE